MTTLNLDAAANLRFSGYAKALISAVGSEIESTVLSKLPGPTLVGISATETQMAATWFGLAIDLLELSKAGRSNRDDVEFLCEEEQRNFITSFLMKYIKGLWNWDSNSVTAAHSIAEAAMDAIILLLQAEQRLLEIDYTFPQTLAEKGIEFRELTCDNQETDFCECLYCTTWKQFFDLEASASADLIDLDESISHLQKSSPEGGI